MDFDMLMGPQSMDPSAYQSPVYNLNSRAIAKYDYIQKKIERA